MKDFHFDAISAFENYEIKEMRDGRVTVTTKVVNSSLNYYGNAHGGYLYTLCDQISGLVVISLDLDVVTLQSSINYLKAGYLGDELTIKGECVHKGRTTCVVDVDLINQDGKNVCKATFTMFITGERSEDRQIRIQKEKKRHVPLFCYKFLKKSTLINIFYKLTNFSYNLSN